MGRAAAQNLREDWKDTPISAMQESGVVVAGDPEECVAQLERYLAAGARYFVVCPVPFTMDAMLETARLYSDHVIPRFDASSSQSI